jgi:Tol biopolymer transport system component
MNKVRDQRFEWKVLRTPRFDIHFYSSPAKPEPDGVLPRAREVAAWLEAGLKKNTALFGVEVTRRVPVFLYRSHTDFEQTNLYPAVPVGVGAFAESLRDRIVIPLYPSERYMQRVLEHELTHVISYYSLYPYRLPSFHILKSFLFPTWFMEGLAQFGSPFRDSETDMRIRDATLDGRLRPLGTLRGFAHLNPHEVRDAYDQSGMFMQFLERELGEGSVSRLLHSYGVVIPWRTETMLRLTFGKGVLPLDGQFRAELKAWAEEAARGKGDPGPAARALTATHGHYRVYNRSPRWSPDGTRIVFLSDRRELTDVYVMDADGSGQRSLLGRALNGGIERVAAVGSALSWSPDGAWVCFVGQCGNRIYLYEVDVEGLQRTVRHELPFDDVRSPHYSPDGKRVALSGVRAGVSDIYVLDLASGGVMQLTADRSDDDAPHWRPDGKEIAYASERAGQTDLFAVDPATGRTRRLTDTLSMERDPAWSPDGRFIACSSDAGGTFNIHVVDTATGRARRLTDVKGGAFSPTWSPDGKDIAFAYFRHGHIDIYGMRVSPAGEFLAPAREEERLAEHERFFTRQVEDFEVEMFRDRQACEFLLPLVLVNLVEFADLRGDHRLTTTLVPYASTSGAMILGEVTWWDLSGRADVGLSVRAQAEADDPESSPVVEDREYGVELFAAYPFNRQKGVRVGYAARDDQRLEDGDKLYNITRAGLFAKFVHDNLIGRGATVTGGSRLAAGVEMLDESLGSERDSERCYVDFRNYAAVTRDQVVALRARADWGNGPGAPEQDLARLVRGLEPNTSEGPNRFGASVEYRFPLLRDVNVAALGEWLLVKDLRGYFFADAGFATSGAMDGPLEDLGDPAWHSSLGVGLRLDCWLLQEFAFSATIEAQSVDGEAVTYAASLGTVF